MKCLKEELVSLFIFIFFQDIKLYLNFIHFKIFFNYSWFRIFCPFLLYSKVTQSHIYTHSLSHIICHHVPSQVIGHSFLCYTAGPHCLSILNVTICICQLQTGLSPSILLPLDKQVCRPCLWICSCSVGRFICAIFYIPHISDMWYLSFSYLLHLGWESLVPSMLLQMASFFFFIAE